MKTFLRVCGITANLYMTLTAIALTFVDGVEQHSNAMMYLFITAVTIFAGLLISLGITENKKFLDWYLALSSLVALGLSIGIAATHLGKINLFPYLAMIFFSFWGWPIPRPNSRFERFVRSVKKPIVARLRQIMLTGIDAPPTASELAQRDEWDANRQTGKQHGW